MYKKFKIDYNHWETVKNSNVVYLLYGVMVFVIHEKGIFIVSLYLNGRYFGKIIFRKLDTISTNLLANLLLWVQRLHGRTFV